MNKIVKITIIVGFLFSIQGYNLEASAESSSRVVRNRRNRVSLANPTDQEMPERRDITASENDMDPDIYASTVESLPTAPSMAVDPSFQEVPFRSDEESARDSMATVASPTAQQLSLQVQQTSLEQAPLEIGVSNESAWRDAFIKDKDEVDLDAKRRAVIELVEQGAKYLDANKDYDAFQAFTHGKKFLRGELYIFVYDQEGICLAHGEQSHLVWKNMINERDTFGTPIVKTILKKGKEGGGWITYQWRGATKLSYVKQVIKNGVTLTIGAGFYPHSKADAVVSLVKGAVALFKAAMKEGRRKEEIFSTLSYPMGRFVYGDLYLYALDFRGNHMAHGDRPGLIGTNAWNYRSQGKFVNQEIIEQLKKGSEGVWVEYFSKNALKRAYAEKITDREGNSYFIACGYYPDANRDRAVDLVRKGYEYMKSHGESLAARMFTDKQDNSFRYGDLFLAVYDFTGRCTAHGGNPEFVGQNFFDYKDQDGKYPVREMIEKAKREREKAGGGEAGGGWVNYKMKNSFVSAYVKPIKLGLKEYIITCGLYPITKKETALLLVKSGSAYLKSEPAKEAFHQFVSPEGKFIRGDLGLFAFAFNGICLAWADDADYIWKNMLDVKDDRGVPYVQVFINTARNGSGKVTYTIDGVQKIVFVERVDTNSRSYVIGSGYFK